MSTLMMGALIFGLSGALAMLMKRKIEELFCFSICGVILILYVFGILGFLQAGVWVAIAICLAGGATLIWFVIRGHFKEIRPRVVTPGALVFGIIIIALYFGHKNRLFFYYDEFTHWGLALKNYWLMEAFPYGMESSIVHFQDYPPAIPLSIVIFIPLYDVIAYYACQKWMPKEEARSGWVFHLTVALGAVVYLFPMLMTYLIAFPPDEAAMIVSFSRYISAYLFAMFAILIFDILRYRWREDSSYGFPCAVAMLCVLGCVNPARIYPATTMAQQHIKDGWDSREAIYKIDVSGMDPAKDRLYYVVQNGQSQQYWMERYVLTPLRAQS